MRSALQVAGGLLLALLASRWSPPSLASLASLGSPLDTAPPALPDAVREHADPVASYTLRARLDPVAHLVHGEGTLTWRNTSRVPQQELYVHLYLNAFESERSVFLRTPYEGFRGAPAPGEHGSIDVTRFAVREMEGRHVWPEGRPTTPGDPDDRTDIRVPLPRPVAPGEQITIDLAWDAHLPRIALRTGHFGSFHLVAQWFPKVARLEPDGRWAHFPFHRLSEFYADFGAYDVTIDTPDTYLVGATGRLVAESRAAARIERRFVQDDVHDFAFAAWDRFRELTATTDDGIAIRALYPPGEEDAAALEVDIARFGLAHFGALLGPYPYRTLTIVHPPAGADEAGGMEYPTLITTGGAWDRPFTGGRGLASLTLHELAHQWFQGMVATDEHRYPYLDEGLTTWAELDALRARYGASTAARLPGLDLDLTAIHRAGALITGPDGPIARPATEFQSGLEYGGLVYTRMSTLIDTLARVHGEETIRGAIAHYARAHRFAHPGPDDLIASIRAAAGDSAAAALRTALFEGARVDYLVAELSPAHDYALVRRRGDLAFPVDIDLHAADGTTHRVRWDAAERAARIPYTGDSHLVAAVIDPDHRVLLDEDLTNNARRLDRAWIAPRVLERATFAAGALLWALTP